MKLHTVFITYNRLELTKQAIESYLETVNVESHSFLVMDNGSTDGTVEWITSAAWDPPLAYWLLEENRYPGFATNLGWQVASGIPEITHFHRADNDFAFLPGWCDEVERAFSEGVGQVGLRTAAEELHNTHNVGGNCVIDRRLWDEGLRWDERPWPEIKPPGYTEDSYFSPQVVRMGYVWTRVQNPCIVSLADEDPYDEYYRKTWKDRGILKQSLKAYGVGG